MIVGMLLASLVATQGTFEGTVTGTMTTDGKTAPFKYYQLGNRVRQEFQIEDMTAASIYDGTTGDMITLMPQQRKYMVFNLRQMGEMGRQMANAMGAGGRGGDNDAADLSKTKVTATGRTETIAGIPCQHYLFDDPDDDDAPMDICGATGMGFMGMAGEGAGGSIMPSTIKLLDAQNPDLARLARQGFFPLRMTMSQGAWLVTQVDRRRPDAALFAPPPGYTKLEMPGMGGRKP